MPHLFLKKSLARYAIIEVLYCKNIAKNLTSQYESLHRILISMWSFFHRKVAVNLNKFIGFFAMCVLARGEEGRGKVTVEGS